MRLSIYLSRATIILVLTVLCFCQGRSQTRSVSHAEIGFSLGGGWGFDLGYGKVDIDSTGAKTGIVFIGSLYTPYFGERNPDGEEGYFDWFEPTTTISQKGAFGLGIRYLLGEASLGIMFDRVRTVTFQNYISTATQTGWHSPGEESFQYGFTGTLSYRLKSGPWITLYFGENRPIMAGAVFVF